MSADSVRIGGRDDLTLGSIFYELLRGRWVIAATTVLFTGIFGTIAFLTTPVFQATTWMMPAETSRNGSLGAATGQLSNLASLVGIDFDADRGAQTQEALAVLKSREFRRAFIADLQLMPILFAQHWDGRRRQWQPGSPVPDEHEALEKLDTILSVGRNIKTGLLNVQVEWTDPRRASDWANALVERVNAEMRRRTVERCSAMVAYLEKELATTDSGDARDAVARLLAAQINERMFASVDKEYAFKVVERAPVPDKKIRPRYGLQLMLGVVTGMLLGIVLVFFSFGLGRASVAPRN